MSKIFHINAGGELSMMLETPYESEDLLQTLLERYPDVLAGEQINPEAPRRWLLVKREMDVPDATDGTGRWSLDHLFLDQDGVLTLVEVKRATDTRARREVVAQMLDYAANAVLYWPVEQVIASFEATARAKGNNPHVMLTDFLANGDATAQADDFWSRVKANLGAERIRMVFVADVIHRDLQRIVEFLNQQMNPAEVVAIEVRQYVNGKTRTLVPRIVGHTLKTAKSTGVPRTRARRDWDQTSFEAEARTESGETTVRFAQRLKDWFGTVGAGVTWGSGRHASMSGNLLIGGEPTTILQLWATGECNVLLKVIADTTRREEFRRRLDAVPGLRLSAAQKEPTIESDHDALLEATPWQALLSALEWLQDPSK